MRFIIFAAIILMMSLNTFAVGQNADKGCHYCTPCKKVVCKDTFVDDSRNSDTSRKSRIAKRAARKARRTAGKTQ